MYSDTSPCSVCGSAVRLTASDVAPGDLPSDGPVGPTDGVVGTADDGPDVRVCTNPDCPTHADDSAERP